MAGGTKKNKRPRLLRDVIQEFQTKVIDAAKKLQLELSDSAAQPVLNAVEQFAPMDTAASVDLDEEPALSELGARHRSRVNCCPHFDMVRVVFRIGLGGEIATEAQVCENATVGTFNSSLKAKGFVIPAGTQYVCAGRSLEADNTEQRVYDPDIRDETGEWRIVLPGPDDGSVRILSLEQLALCQ